MTPTLSLVTGTLNRPESFARLVSSIVEHTSVEWELVVSDASDVTNVSSLPQVRILPEKPRLGCVRGFNRAFQAALGEWVIYLNDDAEVCPHYDVEAIAFMEAHPQIGIGALHYSECGGPFRVNEAWGAVYCNFGILRRSLGNQVGWMDEGLAMYGNDNSLTLRVLLADKGVADIPAARILHHSVKDGNREANQVHKQPDNRMLAATYLPVRRYWLANYRKHRVPSATVPWSHGVRPQAVKA